MEHKSRAPPFRFDSRIYWICTSPRKSLYHRRISLNIDHAREPIDNPSIRENRSIIQNGDTELNASGTRFQKHKKNRDRVITPLGRARNIAFQRVGEETTLIIINNYSVGFSEITSRIERIGRSADNCAVITEFISSIAAKRSASGLIVAEWRKKKKKVTRSLAAN